MRRFSVAVIALAALGLGAPAVAASQLPDSSRPDSSRPDSARPDSATRVTKSGLVLTVTPTRALDPAGATLRVSGKGFDPTVGIYVALCVTPRKGQVPSPCGGGVNTSGTSPASAWISSNPPPYGGRLAVPYRPGGRFAVRLQVAALIGDIDCRAVACSIVTRADHTHPGDRRFDVAVPVSFRAQ